MKTQITKSCWNGVDFVNVPMIECKIPIVTSKCWHPLLCKNWIGVGSFMKRLLPFHFSVKRFISHSSCSCRFCAHFTQTLQGLPQLSVGAHGAVTSTAFWEKLLCTHGYKEQVKICTQRLKFQMMPLLYCWKGEKIKITSLLQKFVTFFFLYE